MVAYYNEIDPFAAQWLRELIQAGHIALGVVDERSVEDVTPNDLKGFTQCHFFAGIGVWSYALRQAGWPDERPVWTGSCPCQPFSTAGKGKGFDDERHLWPSWFWLITQCRPSTVFGEQVGRTDDAKIWMQCAINDIEGVRYRAACINAQASDFGANHERERVYWVADTHNAVQPVGTINDETSWLSEVKRKLWTPPNRDDLSMANGSTRNMGIGRGFGNSLFAPQAQAFIESYMLSVDEPT